VALAPLLHTNHAPGKAGKKFPLTEYLNGKFEDIINILDKLFLHFGH
jgi:hypothetical protein